MTTTNTSIKGIGFINVLWGFALWQEIPTVTTVAGAFLTLLSGLYILIREQKVKSVKGA